MQISGLSEIDQQQSVMGADLRGLLRVQIKQKDTADAPRRYPDTMQMRVIGDREILGDTARQQHSSTLGDVALPHRGSLGGLQSEFPTAANLANALQLLLQKEEFAQSSQSSPEIVMSVLECDVHPSTGIPKESAIAPSDAFNTSLRVGQVPNNTSMISGGQVSRYPTNLTTVHAANRKTPKFIADRY